MQNNDKEIVDLYLPRKCSATNTLIGAKDHAAVQIQIAKVDGEGKAVPGEFDVFALCGSLRQQGEADDSLNRLCEEKGICKGVFKA
eukprot:m.8736 g.8736  ORF g.8736 m.8736 type:complete len:86 (-) comp5283_c0_seq1:83-340(-)